MSHIMLNIEALSSASNSVIVSLGAVRFDLISGEVFDSKKYDQTFSQIILPKSDPKGHIDGGTFLWWLEQEEEARKALTSGEALPLESALKAFSAWVRETPCSGIWGDGVELSITKVKSAYERLGWVAPWPQEMTRCYRTMKELFPQVKCPELGLSSTTLNKSITQARHLGAIREYLYE